MTTQEVNIQELGFGIEIETHIDYETIQNERMTIGSYHHGIQVPFLPNGWKAESDSSICAPVGRRGCEITSPILKGRDGLKEAMEVARILRNKGFKVNSSTGLHISIGFDRNAPAELLSRLISVTAYLEKAIYAATGSKSRERGHYCKGFQKYGNAKSAKKELDQTRYTLLNITNLQRGQSRVEFRAFTGTTSDIKIAAWVQICLGVVERALTTRRLPSWNPKPTTGGWKKAGPGASELERCMGYLAWSDGTRRLNGGKSFGWIATEEIVTENAIKTELRRLAKKYDAE